MGNVAPDGDWMAQARQKYWELNGCGIRYMSLSCRMLLVTLGHAC